MRPRTKPRPPEKPASQRKPAIAKLVQPLPHDIDDDADDRQRVGVQSLARVNGRASVIATGMDAVAHCWYSLQDGLAKQNCRCD